jgi:uncharacterized membrane protein
MQNPLLIAATVIATIGSGVIGGVFFAFSTFVMKALGRLPAPQGMAAMQAINVAVINPIFVGVFMGTALFAVVPLMWWERPGAAWLAAGAILYVVGNLLVTVVFNVPLNNALAAMMPTDPGAEPLWETYQKRWTAWNHVRTAASLAAMAAFIMALRE